MTKSITTETLKSNQIIQTLEKWLCIYNKQTANELYKSYSHCFIWNINHCN